MTDVLVVDDEAIVAEDLRQSLRSFGYRVPATADTADEAVRVASAVRPDIVVMDIRLKGDADGIDAAGRIRDLLKIPVIYLTAYGDDATLSRAERTSPAGYILKPFNARDLHNAIELGLSRDRLQKEVLAANEALRQANAELSGEREFRDVLIAVVAHDLRGPLSTIETAAEQIVAVAERPAVTSLVQRIRRNVSRADRLVQDLLDAQRLRSGQQLEVELAEVDLAVIARQVRDELAATFGDRFLLEAQGPISGLWNADLLWRALWNLASNAVKYGARRAPIEITVRRLPELALLSVHNTGNPIPAAEQARLFKPFSRLPGTSATAPGWGLGLAVVASCAKAHHGAVRVDSGAEGGTTFTMMVPYGPEAWRGPAVEGASAAS